MHLQWGLVSPFLSQPMYLFIYLFVLKEAVLPLVIDQKEIAAAKSVVINAVL